jgi:hypothetical protein
MDPRFRGDDDGGAFHLSWKPQYHAIPVRNSLLRVYNCRVGRSVVGL